MKVVRQFALQQQAVHDAEVWRSLESLRNRQHREIGSNSRRAQQTGKERHVQRMPGGEIAKYRMVRQLPTPELRSTVGVSSAEALHHRLDSRMVERSARHRQRLEVR